MWTCPGLCRECGRPTYSPVERVALERVAALDQHGAVVLATLLDGPPLPPQAAMFAGWLVQAAGEGVKCWELAGALGMGYQKLASRFERAGVYRPWSYLIRVRLLLAAYYVDRGCSLEEAANRAEFSSLSDLGRAVRRERDMRAKAWLTQPFKVLAAMTRAELFPAHHLTTWRDRPIIVERLTVPV